MTDLAHYQRETERLTRECERQRREIVVLRQDLASALTQYVRSEILIQALGRWQAAGAAARQATSTAEIDDCVALHERESVALHAALTNWKENQLGPAGEILARVDLLLEPIPETP